MTVAPPNLEQTHPESESVSPPPDSVSIFQFYEQDHTASPDLTWAVRRALAHCKRHGISKLVFPPGVYFFSKERAEEQSVQISNNDSGLKRIAFLLDGFQDFEIDGGGARFIFRGFLTPFLVENSNRIVLRNFSVDFERTFHSEGKVLSVGNDCVDVSFSSEFPYKIRHGLLNFIGKPGDEQTEYPAWALLEFDAGKRETALMANDYFFSEKRHAAEIAPGRVRVQVNGIKATPGNVLVFAAAHRLVPAIVIQDSAAVSLYDLTIHHSGGMGIIAQRTRLIALERVRVTPSGGRMVSTTADATHFVNCSGRISMIDCLFENQSDDATNIHGIYARITKIVSPTEIEIQMVHPQQVGFDLIRAETKLEFVKRASLVTKGSAFVKSVERLNGEYSRVALSGPCPEQLEIQDLVASLESSPEVLIKGCNIRNNRARGILLGSPGRILVEENCFHTPGAAILLEGDGSYWFEQAGVGNLTVRRNIFDNCNFGIWGVAVIQVGPGIEPPERPASRYNRNIVIENNLFRVFDPVPLIHGYSIDGLVFRSNRIEKTDDYPAVRADGNRFQITDSSNIKIEE